MIDNRFVEGDWTDAVQVDIGHSSRLYVKQDQSFIYLAIVVPSGKDCISDLFLTDSGQNAVDLHSSAKLGEREATDKEATWSWWNNRDWTASVSRPDSSDLRSFLQQNVREYQIRRTRFSGTVWHLRVEVGIRDNGKEGFSSFVFPEGTPASDSKRWLQLRVRTESSSNGDSACGRT